MVIATFEFENELKYDKTNVSICIGFCCSELKENNPALIFGGEDKERFYFSGWDLHDKHGAGTIDEDTEVGMFESIGRWKDTSCGLFSDKPFIGHKDFPGQTVMSDHYGNCIIFPPKDKAPIGTLDWSIPNLTVTDAKGFIANTVANVVHVLRKVKDRERLRFGHMHSLIYSIMQAQATCGTREAFMQHLRLKRKKQKQKGGLNW